MLGNNLKSCNTSPMITAKTGEMPIFKPVKIPTATPARLPAKSPIVCKTRYGIRHQ